MDRIFACPPEAGQAISRRLRRGGKCELVQLIRQILEILSNKFYLHENQIMWYMQKKYGEAFTPFYGFILRRK